MKVLRIILGILFVLAIAALIFYWPKPKTWLAPPDETWTLLAVGDIQLGREVAIKINQFGADYPFQEIIDKTKEADITFGNLESPFTSGKSNTDPSTMIFGAEIKSVEGLKNAGFDLVDLANNHFSNQGKEGMDLTFDVLNENNINYFGTTNQPLIKTIKNIKIAFLGYTDIITSGTAMMDVEQAKIDLAAVKTQADVIIISMHSGYEYTSNPNNRQIEFARAAIDAGADIVIGHHPHVVQTIEDYKGKKIFYSLGNFIFDQPWSTQTKQGLMVKLTFDGANLTKTDLIPVKIDNWCQPRVLEPGDEYNSIIKRTLS